MNLYEGHMDKAKGVSSRVGAGWGVGGSVVG